MPSVLCPKGNNAKFEASWKEEKTQVGPSEPPLKKMQGKGPRYSLAEIEGRADRYEEGIEEYAARLITSA